MSSGAQYVVAAYAVVLFALVMYVVVLGLKSARIAREVELISRLLERDRVAGDEDPEGSSEASADVVGAEVESADR